jgi:hypothetical protein
VDKQELTNKTKQYIAIMLLFNRCKPIHRSIVNRLMHDTSKSISATDIESLGADKIVEYIVECRKNKKKIEFSYGVLAKKISGLSDFNTPYHISEALHIVKYEKNMNESLVKYLHVLINKMQQSNEIYTDTNMNQCFGGIKSLSCEDKITLNLLVELRKKILLSRRQFSSRTIGTAFFGLQSMTAKPIEVKEMIRTLTDKAIECTDPYDAQSVGNLLYGFKSMDSESPDVRVMLDTLAKKIHKSKIELDAQSIGNALYGMRNMSSDHVEVRKLIHILADKISDNEGLVLDGQAISNGLYGLRCMNSDYPEVRKLQLVLSEKILQSKDHFIPQHIANTLYSMRYMSSDETEIRNVLNSLYYKYIECKEQLSRQEISTAVYGLQRMKADNNEVLVILEYLATMINGSRVKLDAQGVGNSLYGLQNMDSDIPEVKLLINALTQKIKNCKVPLLSQHISNAVYGMKLMKSNNAEVIQLVSALTKLIADSPNELNAQRGSKALYGMQQMSNDKVEVANLLRAITEKIAMCRQFWNTGEICLGLFGLRKMRLDVSKSDAKVVTDVIKILKKQIQYEISQLQSGKCDNKVSIQNLNCLRQYMLLAQWNFSRNSSNDKTNDSSGVNTNCDIFENEINAIDEQLESVSLKSNYSGCKYGKLLRSELSDIYTKDNNLTSNIRISYVGILHGFEMDIIITVNNSNNTVVAPSLAKRLIGVTIADESFPAHLWKTKTSYLDIVDRNSYLNSCYDVDTIILSQQQVRKFLSDIKTVESIADKVDMANKLFGV